MKKKMVAGWSTGLLLLGTTSVAQALILDFSGGTAYLSNGMSVVTDNEHTYSGVDYYIEDGFKVDFLGGTGTIGNYYGTFAGNPGDIHNSVIHAHWSALGAITFKYLSGEEFDLNYMDLSSNTTAGGGFASGNERSYVTSSDGYSMLLPSSDWGMGYLSSGQPDNDATPIERLWLDSNFDSIASFTVTSQNAYCFGLDNFYINEPPPPPNSPVPEPATMFLFGTGIAGLAGTRLRAPKKA